MLIGIVGETLQNARKKLDELTSDISKNLIKEVIYHDDFHEVRLMENVTYVAFIAKGLNNDSHMIFGKMFDIIFVDKKLVEDYYLRHFTQRVSASKLPKEFRINYFES